MSIKINLQTPNPPDGYQPTLGDEFTTSYQGEETLWAVDLIEDSRFEAREQGTTYNNALAFAKDKDGKWGTLFMYTRSEGVTSKEVISKILTGNSSVIQGGFVSTIPDS